MLTREMILAATDVPREKLEVPEWGGEVYVRTLTGYEMSAFEKTIASDRRVDIDNVYARFAAAVLVDENGKRIFSDVDAHELGLKGCKALKRVYDAGMRLNGVSESDVEELAKNSGRVPSNSSGTS